MKRKQTVTHDLKLTEDVFEQLPKVYMNLHGKKRDVDNAPVQSIQGRLQLSCIQRITFDFKYLHLWACLDLIHAIKGL